MKIPILENLQPSVIKDLGYKSMDHFAIEHQFSSWEDLINAIKNNNNILDSLNTLFERIFLCRITGWEAINQHFSNTSNADNITVVDSTLYRVQPEKLLKRVADRANISFSNQVVNWEGRERIFDVGDEEQIHFYRKVIESTKVQSPSEIPIPISNFPAFIQEHLVSDGGAIHIYLMLLRRALRDLKIMSPDEIINTIIKDDKLGKIDPVFSYALISQFDKNKARGFKEQYPIYQKSFQCIDDYNQ